MRTALTFQLTAEPGWIDVTVGSLDEPSALSPDSHIWTSSQLTWLRIEDDLPRHAAAAPAEAPSLVRALTSARYDHDRDEHAVGAARGGPWRGARGFVP